MLICLTLVSSSNATIKKGMFGEEKRFYTDHYSVAILEGSDVHPKSDLVMGKTIADLYYSSEGYNTPSTYVYCINSEDIGVDENGDNMFKENYSTTSGYFPQLTHPKISILETEKVNNLTLYYIKKTENSINGNEIFNYYYLYGVGEKENYTYCIFKEDVGVENRDDEDNGRVLENNKKSFIEIFNSIKRED